MITPINDFFLKYQSKNIFYCLIMSQSFNTVPSVYCEITSIEFLGVCWYLIHILPLLILLFSSTFFFLGGGGGGGCLGEGEGMVYSFLRIWLPCTLRVLLYHINIGSTSPQTSMFFLLADFCQYLSRFSFLSRIFPLQILRTTTDLVSFKMAFKLEIFPTSLPILSSFNV